MGRRIVTLLLAAAVLAGCGSDTTRFEDEMYGMSRVLVVAADDVAFDGKDAEGSAGSAAEAQLDVHVVQLADAEVVEIYDSVAPADDPYVFVRDPRRFGSFDEFVDGASTVVIVTYPLINQTRGGVAFEARLVALGSDGSLLRTDWESGSDDVEALVSWAADEGVTVGEAFALAVRGLVAPTGDPAEEAAAAVVRGG